MSEGLYNITKKRDWLCLNALYIILLNEGWYVSECALYDIIKMRFCTSSECAFYDIIKIRAGMSLNALDMILIKCE